MFELWVVFFENGKPTKEFTWPVEIQQGASEHYRSTPAIYKTKGECLFRMFADGSRDEGLQGQYNFVEGVKLDPIVKFECRPVAKGAKIG